MTVEVRLQRHLQGAHTGNPSSQSIRAACRSLLSTLASSKHLHPRLPCINMDDIRGSFSKLKKKLKYPLKGGTRKPEKMGSDSTEESVGQMSSLPRPEHHIAVGGDSDQGGKGAGARVDQPLQRGEPEPTPPVEGDSHQDGGEKDLGRSGPGQRAHPHPDIEPAAESEELERALPSASPTPILHSAKPESM